MQGPGTYGIKGSPRVDYSGPSAAPRALWWLKGGQTGMSVPLNPLIAKVLTRTWLCFP